MFVDLQNAQMTITTGALPNILQGVPLRIRGVNLTIDRPGFMLNPTSCERQRVSATVIGATGAQALLSSPFALAGCVSLPFSPSLAASTTGLVTQASGAALALNIRNPQGTQANIRAISVVFPKQFSPRLTTIQAACTQATFATNPASCPLTSVVGLATVRTPNSRSCPDRPCLPRVGRACHAAATCACAAGERSHAANRRVAECRKRPPGRRYVRRDARRADRELRAKHGPPRRTRRSAPTPSPEPAGASADATSRCPSRSSLRAARASSAPQGSP